MFQGYHTGHLEEKRRRIFSVEPLLGEGKHVFDSNYVWMFFITGKAGLEILLPFPTMHDLLDPEIFPLSHAIPRGVLCSLFLLFIFFLLLFIFHSLSSFLRGMEGSGSFL